MNKTLKIVLIVIVLDTFINQYSLSELYDFYS